MVLSNSKYWREGSGWFTKTDSVHPNQFLRVVTRLPKSQYNLKSKQVGCRPCTLKKQYWCKYNYVLETLEFPLMLLSPLTGPIPEHQVLTWCPCSTLKIDQGWCKTVFHSQPRWKQQKQFGGLTNLGNGVEWTIN